MLKKMSVLFLLPLLLLSLGGCGMDEEKPSSSNDGEGDPNYSSDDSQFVEYGVAGDIVEITTIEDEDVNGSILVEGPEENGATYTEAVVSITTDTKIYLNELTDFDNLEVGMYVNVFFEGNVMESFPVQATARQVNIIPDDAK